MNLPTKQYKLLNVLLLIFQDSSQVAMVIQGIQKSFANFKKPQKYVIHFIGVDFRFIIW